MKRIAIAVLIAATATAANAQWVGVMANTTSGAVVPTNLEARLSAFATNSGTSTNVVTNFLSAVHISEGTNASASVSTSGVLSIVVRTNFANPDDEVIDLTARASVSELDALAVKSITLSGTSLTPDVGGDVDLGEFVPTNAIDGVARSVAQTAYQQATTAVFWATNAWPAATNAARVASNSYASATGAAAVAATAYASATGATAVAAAASDAVAVLETFLTYSVLTTNNFVVTFTTNASSWTPASLTLNIKTNVGGSGTGSGFPLTENVSANGYNLEAVGLLSASTGRFTTLYVTNSASVSNLTVRGATEAEGSVTISGDLTVLGTSYQDETVTIIQTTNVYGGTNYIETTVYSTQVVYQTVIVYTNIVTTNNVTTYVNEGGTFSATNAELVAMPNLRLEGTNATATGTWNFAGATVNGLASGISLADATNAALAVSSNFMAGSTGLEADAASNLVVSGDTFAYTAAPTNPYVLGVSATAPRFTYSLSIYSTNACTLTNGVTLVGGWTPTGTNLVVLVPTGTAWRAYGKAY